MVMEALQMTVDVDDVLRRRMAAKAEIDRLKTIMSACDAEIMEALDADTDEFLNWVREVRGEVVEPEKRKIHWSDGQDNYVVFKREGSKPRKSINPSKLLQQGVRADVIANATEYGQPGKPSVSVRKVTGGMDDDEE